jgi:anti-sigma factor RsiW
MTMSPLERRARRRTSRSRPAYWLAGLAVAAILFGLGVAVGEALHDNPTPGITHTSVRTLHP